MIVIIIAIIITITILSNLIGALTALNCNWTPAILSTMYTQFNPPITEFITITKALTTYPTKLGIFQNV